jgi:hypothetical protein
MDWRIGSYINFETPHTRFLIAPETCRNGTVLVDRLQRQTEAIKKTIRGTFGEVRNTQHVCHSRLTAISHIEIRRRDRLD